jgi:hypothetical protein
VVNKIWLILLSGFPVGANENLIDFNVTLPCQTTFHSSNERRFTGDRGNS